MKKSLSEPNCSGFYCENLDETKSSVLLVRSASKVFQSIWLRSIILPSERFVRGPRADKTNHSSLELLSMDKLIGKSQFRQR